MDLFDPDIARKGTLQPFRIGYRDVDLDGGARPDVISEASPVGHSLVALPHLDVEKVGDYLVRQVRDPAGEVRPTEVSHLATVDRECKGGNA